MIKRENELKTVTFFQIILLIGCMTQHILFLYSICVLSASMVQGQRAGLQYPSLSVQTRPKPSDFQGKKILSTPSFGGEVKLSVPCRRFAACKRSLNLRGSRNLVKITFRYQDLSCHCRHTGTWRREWERLKAGKAKANYPQELAQDAVCQSHTGHMTGLWFLPTRPVRLNTNE